MIAGSRPCQLISLQSAQCWPSWQPERTVSLFPFLVKYQSVFFRNSPNVLHDQLWTEVLLQPFVWQDFRLNEIGGFELKLNWNYKVIIEFLPARYNESSTHLNNNDYPHLVPPQSVLVVAGEAVDHDGDGEGENEDATESTETADEFTGEGGGGQLSIPGNTGPLSGGEWSEAQNKMQTRTWTSNILKGWFSLSQLVDQYRMAEYRVAPCRNEFWPEERKERFWI